MVSAFRERIPEVVYVRADSARVAQQDGTSTKTPQLELYTRAFTIALGWVPPQSLCIEYCNSD